MPLAKLLKPSLDSGYVLSAQIADTDEVYDWLTNYLSIHAPIVTTPSSTKSLTKTQVEARYSIKTNLAEAIWPSGKAAPRHVWIAARKPRKNGKNMPGYDLYSDERNSDDENGDEDGLDKDAILFVEPTTSVTQYLQYRNRTIKFTTTEDEPSFARNRKKWLTMSTFLGTHEVFTSLIQTARREYITSLPKRTISIYSPEYTSWYKSSSRTMRPWDSIILPPGIKEWLLADATEFIAEKEYYQERGVPHRRGYLLYGEPGSGKSSLISALAAQLKLDIYIVNLGSKSMDDDNLSNLLQNCPARCILLMEDIDCAFPKRKLNSGKPKDGSNQGDSTLSQEKSEDDKDEATMTNDSSSGVTLSGLLNALDGVASSEGRLLFCTTNWKDKIDAALSRPGRCDVWIEFTHATQDQARALFLHFFRTDFRTLTPSKQVTVASKSEKAVALPTSTSSVELLSLADRFAAAIPEHKVSTSALQGYLIRHKRNPQKAVDDVEAWVRGGFGQDPVLITKDGKFGTKNVIDSVLSEETKGNVLEVHEDVKPDIISTMDDSLDKNTNKGDSEETVNIISEKGKGLEHIVNDDETAQGHNDGIFKRAKTHMRALSRSKSPSNA
ncbi:uncharacterized protein L201_005296 [Kwoniella dendrophila CBS 6074]|uniref:AAA+ ATPase domain-containing protein n=1 Tax=Kwoniella dendrophila CBS 6074 TaxID=1295534 RepID=A0AAX4JZY4_9TREE